MHIHNDIINNFVIIILQKGEIEAAVSDYSTVASLEPHNEEAIMRQATHKFNRKSVTYLCSFIIICLSVRPSVCLSVRLSVCLSQALG